MLGANVGPIETKKVIECIRNFTAISDHLVIDKKSYQKKSNL